MEQYQLKPIGTVRNDESGTWIVLEPEYIPGLEALEGFSHINVIWWFSGHEKKTGVCCGQKSPTGMGRG